MIYYEHHILTVFVMCSEYYCTMVYNVEYHTLLSFYKVAMMDDWHILTIWFSVLEYKFSTVPAFSQSYSMQKLVFGMIITDPEHWRLRLKWREYHSIIAQRTPYNYKSHNAKCGWFVLVCGVIMLQAYWHKCIYPVNWSWYDKLA